jgi:hypothetical protein
VEAAIALPTPDLEATVAVQAVVIAELREANARLVAANAALQVCPHHAASALPPALLMNLTVTVRPGSE